MSNQSVALITGASSGIGYATAVAFSQNNTRVVALARRMDRLQQLAEALPGESLMLQADVQQPDTLRRAVDTTIERFGRLDIVVANAGIGHRGALVESEWSDIETLLRTNIDGVLHSIRATVPHMNHGGHIVIISSVVYNMVSPYAATYGASKAFVSSIAQSLRLELLDRNIQVTDVLVGRTESEFSQKRLGKAGRSSGGIPIMPVEKVAAGIVRVTQTRRKRVALRWFDRLLLAGNMLVPNRIGRRAIKQYK